MKKKKIQWDKLVSFNHKERQMIFPKNVNFQTSFFFFLEFQLMMSAPKNSSLLSD